MKKFFLRTGSLFALLAVAFGAFGSHTLSSIISNENLDIFENGVRYQFLHAITIFALGILFYYRKTNLMVYAGYALTAGIILFSGSLYLLAVNEILGFPAEFLGPVTPIGGMFLITGWGLIFASTYQENEKLFKKNTASQRS